MFAIGSKCPFIECIVLVKTDKRFINHL